MMKASWWNPMLIAICKFIGPPHDESQLVESDVDCNLQIARPKERNSYLSCGKM